LRDFGVEQNGIRGRTAAILSKALDYVSTASIHRYYKRCERTIEAYSDEMTYGTEEFTERVYKGHRQVMDESKW
jgi:hypothetical protein